MAGGVSEYLERVKVEEYETWWRRNTDVPYGTCWCACGESTVVAGRNHKQHGVVKGAPQRFINGHQRRNRLDRFLVEDKGLDSPCWVWQGGRSTAGYGYIRRDSSTHMPVHRFFYIRKYGPLPSTIELHHLCRVKTCVNPEHLQPIDKRDHASLHGLGAVRGEDKPQAKFTNQEVREIRNLVSSGASTQAALARKYGVGSGTINRIVRGVRYGSVV